jgi:anti-sigma factor RsiW
MNGCTDIRARLALYLDEELEGRERAIIETHLRNCEACSRVFEGEEAFLDAIRQPQPLYVASDALRARVEQVINELPPVVLATPSLKQRIRDSLSQNNPQRSRLNARWSVAAAAMVILTLPVAIWLIIRPDYNAQLNRPGPSSFALMAADTHLRHTRGQLPLEIATSGPEQISDWFANKVQFSVKLPNYQDTSGQEKLYKLEGARLVGYKDDYAAYVAYQMRTRPISLVITSDAIAQPSGGEEIKARGLTFHYDAIQGLKVITWSDRGLTYALVSDLEERGQESCVVCHQGAKDQDFIAPLKPR